jgi:hypothetical protein
MFCVMLELVKDGTKVTLTADEAPPWGSALDHRESMEATVRNLANLVE